MLVLADMYAEENDTVIEKYWRSLATVIKLKKHPLKYCCSEGVEKAKMIYFWIKYNDSQKCINLPKHFVEPKWFYGCQFICKKFEFKDKIQKKIKWLEEGKFVVDRDYLDTSSVIEAKDLLAWGLVNATEEFRQLKYREAGII